ncbi:MULTISPECIES: SH3 domain-containing protein [Streptomyces]|uniref:Uncharacterized protein n=1 Tax=Streptomyces pratisoli TaxID=3139917 RepID=A0ACC6QPY3_9ACTN|nr:MULTISPECIES: hypothetical protein [unclassified Streptomyces]MCX4514826.1 hypothetical protein [Streptomyces sp. NBC_01619]
MTETAVPGFRPTHVVPGEGMATWESPDVASPSAPLDPFLPVELVDRRGEWGRVLCANGWSAWVDGRLLIAVPKAPPSAGQPLDRTADPQPLLARAEEVLSQYRRAAQELATGRCDGETFRRRTQGMRLGVVVDGEALWLYDAEHERWVYCDGARLAPFATTAPPSTTREAPADTPRRATEPGRPSAPAPPGRITEPGTGSGAGRGHSG